MISLIKHYFYLLRTLPPAAIWRRVKKRWRILMRRVQAAFFGTTISNHEFLKAFSAPHKDLQSFLSRVRTGRSTMFFIHPDDKDDIITALQETCPVCVDEVIKAADTICRHEFDLLGSGQMDLGNRIDWHTDFKSGFHWDPNLYYRNIHPAPYPGGYDIKVPWELSRCQHFAWLGQAYWFTRDEKYAHEFRLQVEHWIQQNPPQLGVNWVCTMDVALRAVSWLWGYAFFRQSTSLDDAFHLVFHKSLLAHGRHIINNLEYSEELTSNHYLANIVGLIYLGILLPEFQEAQTWRQFGIEELKKEMMKQVYPDGVGFEASTNYHRLSTELFLSATLLAELNDYTFDPGYLERLERMIEVVRMITMPDGTIPIIGDQDNGRVHRLKIWDPPEREWIDFRPLLALGAVWKGNLDWAAAAGDSWEEALWMFGSHVMQVKHQLTAQTAPSDTESVCFPSGGWYVMRSQNFQVVVDVGPNGQNGYGGHAHNDSLSFDLFCQNQYWIRDPGTYLYTQNYDERNLFRSTRMHNTVSLEGCDQNGFSQQNLFQMNNEATPQLIHWETGASYTLLVGEIKFPTTKPIIHRRVLYLDNNSDLLFISDRVIGNTQAARIYFHFVPEVTAEAIKDPLPGFLLGQENKSRLLMMVLNSEPSNISVQTGWISMSYGSRRPCVEAFFDWSGDQVHNIVVIPDKVNIDLSSVTQQIKPIQKLCAKFFN